MTADAVRARPAGSRLRLAIWIVHMAFPAFGLWLLVVRPRIDLEWQHNPSHFWLVLIVALVNVVLGGRMSKESAERGDARLFLVSLAFLSSAGFLALHALATPDQIPGFQPRNAGFGAASPIGIAVAGLFAAASAIDFTPEGAIRVLGLRFALRAGLVGAMVMWFFFSLYDVPPLGGQLYGENAQGYTIALAAVFTPAYLFAAWRYWLVYRRRPSVMLIGVITAFALLAEALMVMIPSRTWHASWWEWHLLMVAGFGFVAYSSHIAYRREGTASGLFNSISLAETLQNIREEYGAALDELVGAIRREAETGEDAEVGRLARGLAVRFDLSEGQADVLERAGESLAAERDQITRLYALVAVGNEARVILGEDELLARAQQLIGAAFGRDRLRVGLIRDGALRLDDPSPAATDAMRTLAPAEAARDGGVVLALPLTVKEHPAGVLEVARPRGTFADRDRSLLASVASQLSIALENARLYAQIDELFHQYMSPDVATAILADPTQAALGGSIVEVTVLFADLRGFTTFSEKTAPGDIVAMLNRYFSEAVPVILGEGGTVAAFIGDAIMALFNAPTRQPDHAVRAARAALALQSSINAIVEENPLWPRFRVGINTGPALVGNIGSSDVKSYTAIGDAVNLAQRLESSAEPGQVFVSDSTEALIREQATLEPVGELTVKGRAQPVRTFRLERLD